MEAFGVCASCKRARYSWVSGLISNGFDVTDEFLCGNCIHAHVHKLLIERLNPDVLTILKKYTNKHYVPRGVHRINELTSRWKQNHQVDQSQLEAS